MANRFGMSYNTGGGGGYDSNMGGGFGNSPATSNNYDSKPKSSNRRNIDEQTLIPVTCKMIVESTDSINGGCVLPDGREPYLIKIIGAVKEVVKSSTNCMYVVEDGTGSVQIKEFIDDSSYNEEVQQQRELASQDGTYIRVVGKLSSYEGNKQVVANSLRKVSGGGNEFTHHLLEVVYSSEKHKKGETMVGRPNMQSSGMMQPNSTVPYGQQNTMTSVRNAPAAGGRNDTLRREVTDFIISSGAMNVSIGADIRLFPKAGKYSDQDVRNIIDMMANDGDIYSTKDDFHYQHFQNT